MTELKITIEAPDLASAINKLAQTIAEINAHVRTVPKDANVEVLDEHMPDPPQPEAPSATEAVWAPATTTPAQVPVMNAPVEPIPAAVPAAPPAIDLETISRAGAALVDQGKMPEILAVLKKYGVEAVTQLQQDQFTAFASDLRALGANI